MSAGKLQKKDQIVHVMHYSLTPEPYKAFTNKELYKQLRRTSRKDPSKKITIKPSIPFRKLKKGVPVFQVHTFPYESNINNSKWINNLTLVSVPFKANTNSPFIGTSEVRKDNGYNSGRAGELRFDAFSLNDSNILPSRYNFHRVFLTLKNAELYDLRMRDLTKISCANQEKASHIIETKARWAELDSMFDDGLDFHTPDDHYMDNDEPCSREMTDDCPDTTEAEDMEAIEQHMNSIPRSPAMSNAFREALK